MELNENNTFTIATKVMTFQLMFTVEDGYVNQGDHQIKMCMAWGCKAAKRKWNTVQWCAIKVHLFEISSMTRLNEYLLN